MKKLDWKWWILAAAVGFLLLRQPEPCPCAETAQTQDTTAFVSVSGDTEFVTVAREPQVVLLPAG